MWTEKIVQFANSLFARGVVLIDPATGDPYAASGSPPDRELVVTTYCVKTAFAGASVGDTVTATQVIDVSGSTPTTVSTIWRNQTAAADLASAPSAANLSLTGATALTSAQLMAAGLALESTQALIHTRVLDIRAAVGDMMSNPADSDTGGASIIALIKRALQRQTTSTAALASIDADVGNVADAPYTGTGNSSLVSGIKGIFARLSAFSLGGGNLDAGTQRVTLAADGPGVGQLTSISTAQTISIGAAPVVAVGATSAMSAVVGAGRTRVVLCPTVDSWIAVGANPTAAKATLGSFFLAAGAQSYPIVVTPGTTRIAVIADGATGFMSIIESA